MIAILQKTIFICILMLTFHSLFATETGTPNCGITAVVSNYVCDDRGTTDPSDDHFSFDLDVTSGPNSSWQAPAISGGWNSYGVTKHYDKTNLPSPMFEISNGSYTLTIQDASDNSCSTTVTITPPATCSPVCPWQSGFDTGDVTSTITRDDNGTPGDLTDDKVSGIFTLLVPSNGDWGVDVKHPVDNSHYIIYGPFSDTQTSYAWGPVDVDIFLANGQNGLVLWYMMDGYTDCLGDLWVPFPAPAPSCSISASASSAVCNDNGTPSDPSDDTYTFDVTVTGTNTGSGWSGNGVNGLYDVSTSFGPYPISGGDQSFVITDDTDGTCVTSTITVSAPAPCSNTPPCSISVSTSTAICNDNGTPSDPSDDTYTFDVTVTGTNTGSVWYGNNESGSYNVPTQFGPYAISGGDQTFNITDGSDPACVTSTITVAAPATCSNTPPCSISVSASTAICSDSGTPSDPSDDTYTFDVTVTGTNTGSVWYGNNESGSYNVPTQFGPYAISGGDQTFNITDGSDPACVTNTITVAAPATCSNTPPCSITALVSNYACDDRGTTDPSDDHFSFDLYVTGGSSASWTSTELGGGYNNYNTTYSYDLTTLPSPLSHISNGTYTINITDAVETSCTTASPTIITPPATCSPICDWSGFNQPGVSSTIVRDDNGTPADPSDDLVSGVISLANAPISGLPWTLGVKEANAGPNLEAIYGPYSGSTTTAAWGPVSVSSYYASSENGIILRYQLDGYTDCLEDLYVLFPEASVGDYTWFDENQNGIQDGSEPIASGVSVDLYKSDGTHVANDITDATGKYLFEELVPGDFYIHFTAPADYKMTTQTIGTINGSDPDAKGTVATFTLIGGQTDLDYDAGFIRKNVCGFVFEDLTNNGVQNSSDPLINGLQVYLMNTSDVIIATAVTNDEGEYSFANIAPGTYYVEFDLPSGFVSGTWKDQNSSSLVDTDDSDMDPYTRKTGLFTVTSTLDNTNCNISAGFSRVALPVELGRFEGFVDGCNVNLEWETLSEKNNEKFQVEYSSDGEKFDVLGVVYGAGTTADVQIYSFLHRNVVSDFNYYRLRQVDFDGTFEYSDVITIQTECFKDGGVSAVFPNPTIDGLINISYNNVGGTKATIKVMNVLGRVVLNQEVELVEDRNVIDLNLSFLTSGHYIILIEQNNKIETASFIKTEE